MRPVSARDSKQQRRTAGRSGASDFQAHVKTRVCSAATSSPNYNHEPGFDSNERTRICCMRAATASASRAIVHTFAGGLGSGDHAVICSAPRAYRWRIRPRFASRATACRRSRTLGVNTCNIRTATVRTSSMARPEGGAATRFPARSTRRHRRSPRISIGPKERTRCPFGGVWTRPFFDGDGPFQSNGIMTFSGLITRGANAQTQVPMADFLLGLPASFSQGGSQIVAEKAALRRCLRARRLARELRTSPLNYGLRWEPFFAARGSESTSTWRLSEEILTRASTAAYSRTRRPGSCFPATPDSRPTARTPRII